MKIALIRHSICNRGSDHAHFQYADYLIRKGHEFHYYTQRIECEIPFNPSIQINKIKGLGKSATIFFSCFRKFDEDIVAFDLVALACLGWLRNRKRIVYLARGFDVSYYSFVPMRWLIHFGYWLAFKILKIPCISVSDQLSARLARYQPIHLITVNNGVDPEFFSQSQARPIDENMSGEKVILLYVRNDFVKGLDVAVKAIDELKVLHEEGWCIWTVGEDLQPFDDVSVKNWGYLKHDQLRDVLCATDIFILPSRSEGLSPLLLQALACGCAVAATEAAHILKDNVNGLVSPVEDWQALAQNVNRLLQDQDLSNRLSQKARALALEYSLQASCSQFEAALQSLAP